MKKLTPEQQTRLAAIHAKASDQLVAAGFSVLRQFTASGSAGTGESFEIWQRNGVCVLVQFYAEAGGVELYKIAPGNSWAAFAEHLSSAEPVRDAVRYIVTELTQHVDCRTDGNPVKYALDKARELEAKL